MSTDHSGKGYTPLPQSISNTDTEDEEERLTRPNHTLPTYRIDGATTIADLHSGHENGMYCPLDETQNLGNNTRNRQNTIKCYQDDIPVMVIEGSEHDNDFWKRKDMSPMRRFCLCASILLCIVTIVIFLYVLPCDNSMVCPPIIESQSSISWDKTLQDVEIHGPITTVPGSSYNLIFLLRGEQYRENDTKNTMIQRQIPPEGGGVISMQGNTGLPLWLVPLKKSPTIIDCASIDIDQSGKPDCIVAGEQGLLVSIEPIAGTIHWSATTHTFSKLPVILPDINADDIEDLLSVAIDDENVLYLAFLSGKTGQLLERYSVNNCTSIDIYNLVSNNTILYNCYDDNAKPILKIMTLKELFRNVKMREIYTKSAKSKSPRLFKVAKQYDKKYNWKPTPYHYLTVENEGACPGQLCRASVNLTLQKLTNESIIIWDHVSSNAFASNPVFLMTSGKPYTFGFTIKFWQWMNLNKFDHVEKATAITEQRLIERVLIVLVNYTDVQAIDTSQSDVTLLCHGFDCQPNLNSRNQFSSISVEYINNNEFPELISYWSSYNVDSTKGLTSKIQVIKMDSIMSNLIHGDV